MDDGANIPRKPRADSARNRERLLEAAKTAFARDGAEASLEAVARAAGVGVGTLYRHFPNRDALIAAVYARDVQTLIDAADRLLGETSPLEALARWFDVLVGYLAAKRLILPALKASADGGAAAYARSAPAMRGAVERLVAAAHAAGEMRTDVTAEDVGRMLVGLGAGLGEPDWEAGARRIVRVFADGLRRA